jgi:hypothetical protein
VVVVRVVVVAVAVVAAVVVVCVVVVTVAVVVAVAVVRVVVVASLVPKVEKCLGLAPWHGGEFQSVLYSWGRSQTFLLLVPRRKDSDYSADS